MNKVLEEIIDQTQTAYVKGRTVAYKIVCSHKAVAGELLWQKNG